jgi:phospholipase D3/4
MNEEIISLFISSSPLKFCTPKRTNDIDSLLKIINDAQQYIYIEVMDYAAAIMYNNKKYWPVIQNALIEAAFNRHAQIKLLVSKWPYTDQLEVQFWNLLNQIENIQVKMFIIPEINETKPIPHARVNHAKFMVTEKQSYVGTSNWYGDYFLNTGGLSWSITSSKITKKLTDIFERDWNSSYSHLLNEK